MRWGIEQIREIAEGVRACTFPAARFHHREHCLMTAYFLKTEPLVSWRSVLPAFIRRYNLAMGGANTEDAGYHETITQFYLDAIEGFLEAHAALGVTEVCNELLDSPIADKAYPLRFYSRELLFSRTARREYLAPDLGADVTRRSASAPRAADTEC
jgi:hypothetical protein